MLLFFPFILSISISHVVFSDYIIRNIFPAGNLYFQLEISVFRHDLYTGQNPEFEYFFQIPLHVIYDTEYQIELASDFHSLTVSASSYLFLYSGIIVEFTDLLSVIYLTGNTSAYPTSPTWDSVHGVHFDPTLLCLVISTPFLSPTSGRTELCFATSDIFYR